MRTIIHRGGLALAALLGLAISLSAAEKPKLEPQKPDRTELWVPSEDLEKVLEKNKNAVLLTPEQYDALIRDAGKMKPGAGTTPPPIEASVQGIQLAGKVTDGESAIRLQGQIRARALAEGWSTTVVTLPWQSIGKLSSRGDALLAAKTQPKEKSTIEPGGLILWMKGPAEHQIDFECAARILPGSSPDERVLTFRPSSVPSFLDLELPAGSQITQGPAREMRGSVHRFFLKGAEGAGSTIAWRLPPPAGTVARVSAQNLRGVCLLGEAELITTYDVNVSSSVTDSPTRQMVFEVSPPVASVTSVLGDTLESWQYEGNQLRITLSTESRAAQMRVELRLPVALPGKDPLAIVLPTLVLSGAKQVPAIAEITLVDGVELLELQANRNIQAAVAEWDAVSGKATAVIRKVTPRIVVDADAVVFVARDFVEVTRTLNAASDVAVDHLSLTLPADEEFLEVSRVDGPQLEWKRVGQTVEIDWQTSIQAQQQSKLTLRTRKKLDSAAATQTLTLANLAIPEAQKIAGYIALDHEPGWRVALKETGGLEDRDVRLTPVKGKMAWFSLREHRLGFEVQRKESIVDAEVTAYALPRARTIEIEGQISLDISGAPLRQIEVKVTPAQAKLLRFTSPLIAEQTLDETTGVWKLALTRESTGRIPLRFRLSMPGKADGGEAAAATTLMATLPRLEIPITRRFRGSWVVEANTDTQLSFATQSLQPIDVLRVPAVQDYKPRHRLVAAFAYGSGPHELTVTAARHASSPLAALVISQLRLTSVLSQDGSSKHEAHLDLSHSGEQFAHVRLPARAQLLSIIVNENAVKPVRGENGAIAIPLPGGSANTDTIKARLLYELPGEPWQSTGKRKLEPVTLLGEAPILATHWTVHAPEGFSYDKVNTGLEQTGTFEAEGIIGKLAFFNPLMPTFNSVSEKSVAVARISNLRVAQSAMELGDLEAAEDQFQKLLQRDPYDAAARRGIEQVERMRSESSDTARDHTRSRMQADVDEQWETKVPIASAADPFSMGTQPSAYIKDKTQSIIFPQVSFSGATLEEAIEFLRVKSRDLDTNERIEERKGANIILRTGDTPSTASITLDLKHVSLYEALRYVTELAGMKFKVEPYAVLVVPLSETTSEQYTRIYRVPPDFLSQAEGKSAIEILKSQGIDFSGGATAVFNSETSQLIVKNTQPNLDLVEQFVQSILERVPDDGILPGMFILSDTGDLPEDPMKARVKEKLDRIILPSVSFADADMKEAIQFLNEAGAKLDSQEPDPLKRGVEFEFADMGGPVEAKLTLDLKDVPLGEALRYVTELAIMKYKIANGRVLIVPITETTSDFSTMTFAMPEKLIVSLAGKPITEELRAQGIQFPQESEVSLNESAGQLTVKSTRPNLDLVEAWLLTHWDASKETPPISRERAIRRFRSDGGVGPSPGLNSLLPPDEDPFGQAASKSGLIPLELELPTSGEKLTFSGTQAPEVLSLGYVSWERQMAWACLMMTAGGFLFVIWGRHRACLRTFLVILILALGVKLVADAQLPLANAALFGWLAALAIWLVFRFFARIESRAVVALLVLGLLFTSNGSAEEGKLAPDPAAHTVVVPYDVKKPLLGQKPKRFYLDRASFEHLWSLAKENRKPEKPVGSDEKVAATIHSAAYRATVEDERLLIEAKVEIGTRGVWTLTALPFKSTDATVAVVRDWMLDGKPTAVVNGAIQIEQPGVHQVQAVIELNRKVGWKEAVLSLPTAAAAFIELTTPGTDGRPEIEGVDLLTEEQVGNSRLFTAVISQPDKLSLKRNPRRPLADAALPALAESELIIGHSTGDAQSLLGTVKFGFPGTERKGFSLALDMGWQISGWTVRQQSGEVAVRHWSAREEAGRRVVNFELDRPVADEVAVTIWGSRAGAVGPMRTPVLEPTVLKGQQVIALLYDESIKLVAKPEADQRRMEKPAGMNPSLAGGRGAVTNLFFRIPLKQTLAYEAEIASSKLESRTDYVFQLSEQKQEMMAAVTLKRARDAWAQLRIGVPVGFEIQSVDGPGLSSWKQEKDELFLQFSSAQTTSEARLIIYLARSVPQPQPTWKLEPLRFSGFEKNSGTAFVVTHAATDARLVGFQSGPDLREADPTELAGVFVITPPQEKKRALHFERGDWSVSVNLERQPVRFSSDGIVLAQATEAGLLVSQQMAFQVEQGALNRVTVKLPATLPEATVKGEALREVQSRVNGAVREYDCSFQSDVLSHAALTFDMELPLAESLSLPMVDVVGVDRLRRFFVLDNSSTRESRVVASTGLETCAKAALPYVPDVLSQPTFYRSKGGAGDLRVAYQQLQSTEGNAAIVTLADITTAWRADGERWDTVVYSVYNRSLQFLPVILPSRAELIGVSVSGEAVRADEEKRADGSLVRLIPLIQTRAGQRSLEVKLIYRMKPTTSGDLSNRKSLRMDDPELLGISAERTVWTAIVPKRFSIGEIEGNMEEVAEESQSVDRLQGLMSDFSRMNKMLSSRSILSKAEGDYALMEAEKLAKKIETESSKVEQLSRSKTDSWRYKTKTGDDDGKDLKLQGKAMIDITDLNEGLAKQKIVLTENRINAPVFNNQGTRQSLTLGNNWNWNGGTVVQADSIAGLIRGAPSVETRSGQVAVDSQTITLNDNTLVQDDFLKQPPTTPKPETVGITLGSGGLTIAKAGAGTLTLSGANTYTGATVVNSGVQVLTGQSLVINGGTLDLGGTTNTFTGDLTVKRQEQTSRIFNAGSNARANVTSQVQAESRVGQTLGNDQANGRVSRERAPGTPMPAPSQAASAMSNADPFAAAPAVPDAPDAKKKANEAQGGFEPPEIPAQFKNFNEPEIPQNFGLEAQVTSQLRATGRRSLMVDVPSDGQAYHFRKLKDHAVLELNLRKAWTSEQKGTALWLGVGLAAWAALTLISNRRNDARS